MDIDDTAVFILCLHKTNQQHDIEVPLNITAKELVGALNTAYQLNIDLDDISQCFLRSENPIALLKGETTLQEYGLYDGTIIHVF